MGANFAVKCFPEASQLVTCPSKARCRKHTLSMTEYNPSHSRSRKSLHIRKSAHDFGAVVFGFMFSAGSIVVWKYCRSEDIVMALPVNTRPQAYADVIGMFVNLAAVRLRPKADREVGEYVRDVAGLVKSASRGALLSFSEVVKEFTVVSDESRHCENSGMTSL